MKKRNRYIIIGLSMVFLIFFLMIVLFLFEKNRELEKVNSTIKMEKQILSDNISSFEYLNSLTIDSFEKKLQKVMIFLFILEIASVVIVPYSQKL